MKNISLGRVPFARASCARREAARRAALLIGTGLFLHAAPAWAVNECGPPPPGGGTVTCPPGLYPNGIDYTAAGNLEVLLQPGVVTGGPSEMQTSSNLRIIGPVNTSLNASGPFFSPVLRAIAPNSVFVQVDDVTGSGEYVSGISANANAVTIMSDRIVTNGPRGVGIVAFSNGSVSIAADRVTTKGLEAYGIQTFGAGNANIVTREVETDGDSSPAIYATPSGSGSTTVTYQKLTTRSTASNGVLVRAGSGNVTITGGTIIGLGNGGGMDIDTDGDITISSDSISSNNGTGIDAVGRNVTIVSREIVSGRGGGIRALGGSVSISSDIVRSASFGGRAIAVSGFGGAVQIVSGTAETSGDSADAFDIRLFGSSATVTAGTTRTLGSDSDALLVRAFEPGNISITSQNITTTGSGSFGIRAIATTGTINLASNGDVITSGGASTGLSAETAGAVTVSANNVGVTGLASDAIAVNGSTSLITIRGLVQASQGLAVRGQGGPVTMNVVAGGTLRGRVSLTGNADRIANAGIFDAIGTSQFGAGADLFENNAGGTVRSVGGTATFAGLETFNNRGLIEMRDGAANDSLVLPGAYAGTGGGRLGLDVDFAAGTADRLVTGAATGSTTIQVQGSGGGFTSGILLVDAGAGTSATAFTLAGGTSSAYLTRDLRFDSANNDFLLVQLPGTAVFETSRFGRMASQLWFESADAVAAQLDTVRDGNRGRGMALWLQGWSGERERSGTQTLAGAGTFDVSFEQDFQGLQGGIDFQAGSGVFGITGGAGRSEATFASGNPVDMEVKNVGLYAQVGSGPLFFNALAKRDWAELEIDPGTGLGAQFDADLFGVQFNAGLRLASGALYAEPSVGISWVQTDLDSFESGPASVEPGDVESLRARAGLRLGARVPLAGGTLLPYVAANAYEELGDRNSSDFTLGETLRLFDEPAGTRGQAAAGLAFAKAGFEAFVRGEMDFSGGADAKAVRAGARLRF